MSHETEPAVDGPLKTRAPELTATQTGISVPVVDRPVHRTVHREEWVPEGMPAEYGQPVKKSSPLYYAEHVGRAGVLAAALGVGAAIAGTTGVASAAPAKADSTTSSPSTTSATKGSSAAENTTKTNSRNAGPAKANPTTSSSSTTSAAGGRTAAENTTRNDSRTDPHTSNRETNARSQTTETESAGVGADETAPDEDTAVATADEDTAVPTADEDTAVPTADEDTTTDTAATPTTPAADTPSETVELPSAPTRDHATPSTATDSAGESTAAPSTEPVTPIPALPEEQSPVADIPTGATPASEVATTAAESTPLISAGPQTPAPVGAVEQVVETVLVPLASPSSQPSPTVQAAQTPMLWKIFPWLRHTKTPSATTTPARVTVASSTATVASSAAAVVSSSVGIKVPASATVFTLRGRDVPGIPDDMSKQFGGVFNAAPYTAIDLDYPVWSLDAIKQGVKILDASLMSTSGNIIVEGHSEGAQIISRWMRTYANDPTRAAMASRITFILTGNPLRAGGGKAIGMKEPDGVIGVATPTSTPYSVIDVARRYDRWADEPHTTNAWTLANSTSSMNSFHTDYTKVSLNDSTNTVWREGNTTYVLTYEKTLPLLKAVSRIAPADFVNAVRAKVEAGYTRVSGDTGSAANIPSVIKIKSARWQARFDKMVLQYGA